MIPAPTGGDYRESSFIEPIAWMISPFDIALAFKHGAAARLASLEPASKNILNFARRPACDYAIPLPPYRAPTGKRRAD
jgi:hypothetical protein